MIDAQAVAEQPVVGLDHVDVAVMGKCTVQAVARLSRLPVPDAVGKNDEIATRVERLAGAEQRACEFRPNELRAAPASTMQDEDCVANYPLRIALRRADRPVMKAELRQFLIGGEAKILDDEIALRRCGILGRVDARKGEPGDKKKKDSEHGNGSPMQRRLAGAVVLSSSHLYLGRERSRTTLSLLHTPPTPRPGLQCDCRLKRSGQAQHGAVSTSCTGHRISGIGGTAPYPIELDTELIEIDSHAEPGIEHVMDRPARIEMFATVAQDTRVSQQANTIEQGLRAVYFAVNGIRVVHKVTWRVIQSPTEILVCDAPVHFRIAIATGAGKGGIIRTNF